MAVPSTGSTGVTGKMESDSWDRVIEGSDGIRKVQNLDNGSANKSTWEAKVENGSENVFMDTIPALKAINGRNGPQAGT